MKIKLWSERLDEEEEIQTIILSIDTKIIICVFSLIKNYYRIIR